MRPTGAAAHLLRRWAPLVLLVAGYVCLRAINLAELWFAASSQAATGPPDPAGAPSTYYVNTPAPAAPGLGGVLTNWDGQWYERIATIGYPSAADARSANDRWTWAFPPLFPMLVRGVMNLTGLGFPISAVLVNLVLGAIATLLLHGLLIRVVAEPLAVAGALSLSLFMSAPLFGLAYSEPAALVFLLVTLRAIVTYRYLAALISVVLLAFTRPVAAPLAAVFVVHWWVRWRGSSALGWSSHVVLAACTLAAATSPFMWNTAAAMLSGGAANRSARSSDSLSGVSRTTSMLSSFDFGWFRAASDAAGLTGVLVLVVSLVVALGTTLVAARQLHLPIELMVWGAAYTVFVLLVTPLTPGLFRYLLLTAPLLVAVPMWALTWRNRFLGWPVFGLIALTGLCSQWFWIRYLYVLDPAPALLPWAP